MDGSPELNQVLRERIQLRLDAIRQSAQAVSLAARLGRNAVRQILTGDNRNPSIATLERLARVLHCDVAYLLGTQDNAVLDGEIKSVGRTIPIVGNVEAGVFREMTGAEPWLQQDQYEQIVDPGSSQHPRARHFAMRVAGDSMNAAKPRPILEGDIAIFVDMVDAELSVTDGEIYLVRRTRDSGQSYEWTLKRAKVFRDRIELTPESSNPKHAPMVIPRRGPMPSDAVEILAVGLLIATRFSWEKR